MANRHLKQFYNMQQSKHQFMLWQTSKTLWLNYPDKYNKIGFTRRLHLWWPLLLCRAIANGFHPTTHKVSLQASKAIILPKTRASRYSHTWISLLYMRPTDPLEFRDAILTWILILIIYTTHHHEISLRDSWNYAYLTPNSWSSYHNHHLLSQH